MYPAAPKSIEYFPTSQAPRLGVSEWAGTWPHPALMCAQLGVSLVALATLGRVTKAGRAEGKGQGVTKRPPPPHGGS